MSDAKEQRRVIAVIMSKPSKLYQTGLLNGIYKIAFEHNCNVVVFSSTHPRSDELCHNGEMSLFTMINYDKLAGVIYVPDTVIFDKRDEVITKPLLKAVKEKNIPLVTIDYKYDGVPCYYCDDGRVVETMVDHLIEVHGCRDIAYMTGKKGHPHAETRLNAFRNAMRRHGLEIQPNREYYGDFWYTSGEGFVDFITSAPNGLPEAIVCACGPMAESVYENLSKRGIHIPRDIKLAGFEEAVPRAPFISTTNRQTSSVGEAACGGLFRLMDGGSVPQSSYISCDIIRNFAITCGCMTADDYNVLSLCGRDIDRGEDYLSEYNTINEAIISKNNAEEMMWCLDWYSYYLKDFKGIYICMCDGWDEPERSLDENKKQTAFTPEMVMYYYRFYDDSGELQKHVGGEIRFELNDMFPLLTRAEGEPAAYVLRAFHFQDRVFGFAAITFGSRLQTPNENFDYWINDVSNALESQRRLNNARYLYNKVQIDAVTDMMTGLYNRNGFNTMFPRMLEQAARFKNDVVVILGDLNGLKRVNDSFGHIEGDEIIKAAASAVSETHIDGAICENNFRIGGDEFVKVVYGNICEDEIKRFRGRFNAWLGNYNKTSGKPYMVHVPLGVCFCRAGEIDDADKMLSEADKLMYQEKIKIKAAMGFDPKRR